MRDGASFYTQARNQSLWFEVAEKNIRFFACVKYAIKNPKYSSAVRTHAVLGYSTRLIHTIHLIAYANYTKTILARLYNWTRIGRVYIQARFSSTQYYLVRMTPNKAHTHEHIHTRKFFFVKKSFFGSVNLRTKIKDPKICQIFNFILIMLIKCTLGIVEALLHKPPAEPV